MKYFANPIKKERNSSIKGKSKFKVTFFLYVRGQVLFTVEWTGVYRNMRKVKGRLLCESQ